MTQGGGRRGGEEGREVGRGGKERDEEGEETQYGGEVWGTEWVRDHQEVHRHPCNSNLKLLVAMPSPDVCIYTKYLLTSVYLHSHTGLEDWQAG